MAQSKAETTEAILEVATRLFAAKGYDGTRVSEIARDAGISQALIYYNFKSKAEILDAILDRFRGELMRMFHTVYHRDADAGGGPDRWEKEEIAASLEFLSERRNVVRILTHESLKTTSEHGLFEVWDEVNRQVRRSLLAERGYALDVGDVRRSVADAFFIFIPAMLFTALGGAWRSRRSYEEGDVTDAITDILNCMYERFLREDA